MENVSNHINFSLIICTYQRAGSLKNLLDSVNRQSLYPNQIVIVDASLNVETQNMLQKANYKNLEYFLVNETNRGLTKQRNFGISKIDSEIEVVCFLDDDIVLSSDYFENLMKTYKIHPDAIGVSGYIVDETDWRKTTSSEIEKNTRFYYDGWNRVEGSRFQLRRKFGLAPDENPGIMPNFSHGYSTGFLPPSGEIYEVELMMGGIASYKTELFKKINFSEYFEGYGLYEDADFSLRASKLGKLYMNTTATLEHHHHHAGRPNMFKYGKMVIRNGWYVWHVKYPKPGLEAAIKWHSTALLLTLVRLGNTLNSEEKKVALQEALGRITGWWSLWFNKPKPN